MAECEPWGCFIRGQCAAQRAGEGARARVLLAGARGWRRRTGDGGSVRARGARGSEGREGCRARRGRDSRAL